MTRSSHRRTAVLAVLATLAAFALSGCAWFESEVDKFDQAFNGIKATMTTYNQYGQMVDEIKGQSFRVTRDEEFDGTNADGSSKADSSVLLISLGKNHVHHVGSTMILAQNDLTDVTAQLPKEFRFENAQSGTPWINDIKYRFQQFWKGASKTIMIRSQDGTPIKVYAGNQVEILSTDVPKSTRFRIDGKTLFVYRADYTVVDNALLK